MKIIISQYLSRESSEFDDIWYADSNFDPGDRNVFRNSHFQDGGRMLLKIILFARTRLHIEMKFGVRRHIRTHTKVRWWKFQFKKSNMANGHLFENHYISISQPRVVWIARILVCNHKFWPRRRKRDKNSEIRKFRMVDGCRIENHFLAITQLHIVLLRWNLEWGGRITRIRRSDDQNA